MLTKQKDVLEFGLCLIDIISVLICVYIVGLYPDSSITPQTPMVLVFIHIAAFYMSNCFKHFYRRGYLEEFKALTYYSIYLIVSISLLIFLTKEYVFISRRGMILFIPLNFILCYIIHILVKVYSVAKSKQYNSKKVFLITTMDRINQIYERMIWAKAWEGSITAISIADDFNVNPQTINKLFPNAEIVGWDIIEDYAIHNVVDEVFINLSRELDDLAVALVNIFEVMGFDISMNIRSFDVPSNTIKKVRSLAGFQVVTFSHVFHNEGEVFLKRVIDIIGSIIGIVVTFFVGIILIPLILLETPGNPIFSQNRVGKNGRVFKFYKFRSMYKDADKRKAELLQNNEMDGLMFKMEDDPRITKIGRFIRKTSLDELPQFFNVLRGDMSLVGTRPPTEDEYKQYSAHHKRRLSFKPGITGLWQVSGRNEINDFDEVVKLDVEYITNWSLWLDIKILLLTFKIVLLGRGAK